ncbi:MAG: hypothetical protein K2F57_03310 [Candidatus Gastranaerophilales bacterium]|nr:hypothetical protein [Candidatus Gastranaerophilales bacterium]
MKLIFCYSFGMHNALKYIWILLTVFTLMGLMSLIPFDKYQGMYLKEYHRIKSEPQRRVDATYRYIEAIENGFEDISGGILSEPPKKYYTELPAEKIPQTPVEKYKKPLYVRDKHNPNIWYRYRGK